MRRAFRRFPVASPSQQKAANYTFPAPSRGLVLNENLASARPGGASILDNWFPTQTGARVRGGSRRKATLGSGPVRSMFNYSTATRSRLFAADTGSVYDITDAPDPLSAPGPDITGQTNGYYSYQQFATVGGEFLYITNGVNEPVIYNGTTWTKNDPAATLRIGAAGLDTKRLSHVWAWKNRLFFIERDTMNAWYLPVDSIYGTLKQVSLAGVFQKGGSLLTGATWSLDTGSGLDDQCVFISTEGEVAIYQGTDPSSGTTWGIKGRYDITPPMGRRALMQAGGDLLIGTQEGIVPLSEVLSKDPAALSLSAVTRQIEPSWKFDSQTADYAPWEILKWPSRNMALVSVPPLSEVTPHCWAVNLQTGAWGRFTGWRTMCLALHLNQAYFGTDDGRVMMAEVGGNDDGAIYVSAFAGLPDHLRAIGRQKQVHTARSIFVASQPFNPRISVGTDYAASLPTPPSSPPANAGTDRWDVGLWDVAKWDGGAATQVSTRWASIGMSGLTILPQIQITNGSDIAPDAELIAFDVLYEAGGVMV